MQPVRGLPSRHAPAGTIALLRADSTSHVTVVGAAVEIPELQPVETAALTDIDWVRATQVAMVPRGQDTETRGGVRRWVTEIGRGAALGAELGGTWLANG